MSFSDVHPGDPINATNVQQVIDALKGTAGKGVPLAVSAVNDSARYALTLENTEATNSRALNVLKNDGSVLIRADATGVTLGQPLNLPTGSVTSTAILDGTIATADLANQAVTNAKLGTDTARLNLLTNGGFEIWQRGNGPYTTNGAYSADRWSIVLGGGAGTVSVTRIASTIGSNGFSAQFALTFAAGTFAGLLQKYEDFTQLRNMGVTFAVNIKASVVGAVMLQADDGVTQTNSPTNTGTGLQRMTVTKSFSGTASTALFSIYCHLAGASVTVEMNDAMLVVGSVPADYAPLHPADDLARCLRYYEIAGVGNQPLASGLCISNTGAYAPFRYKAVKAVTPTNTFNGTQMAQYGGGLTAQITTATASGGVDSCFLVASAVTGNPLTIGQAMNWFTSGGSVMIMEANP